MPGLREKIGDNSDKFDVPPSFADGTIKVDGADLNRARVELAKLHAERKALSEREREVMKGLTSKGHSKRAIRSFLMVDRMDPDDRADYLAELDVMLTWFKFW